ncbi:MFS general substrate transporter [Stereum hirsutum FP-91666 SS1]|uniref:MFS general substrate transporter n=1 Tax=Stereum hirsutum (strain FP-91666) TaxID=721885 RepID=R7RZ50_STEHR|nr:MFS general substrate transporter [Stereum hirsutum FP-91666 SS1]EIM79592.1 MFS general substrate transporter [Stereum hirsutum FP-91666 SS1]
MENDRHCGAISLALKPTPFKEGGIHGYLTVFGSFLALFATFGQMNAFGSFQLWYSEHQLSQYSPSDISWIGSLQLWVFFFSGGIIGRFFDAYGPRWLLVLGTLIYTFSLMMTSLATKYYQFILAQGVVFGIGVGLLFYPSLSAAATHFSKYRATAVGIAVAGSSVGGVVFPLLLQRLFNEVGFPWAVRISGFVCLACGVVACLTCTSRLPPKKPGPWIDVASFRDVKFMLFSIGSGTCCLGIFVPFFYIVQYSQDQGVSQRLAFDLLSVMNAGSVFGRVLPGYIADLVGRYNMLAPFAVLAGIFSLALWLNAHNVAALTLYSVFYGFFSGAFISLNTPCIAQISRMDQIGTRIGMAYSLLSFPSLVGGPIAGAILTRQHGDFSGLIIYTGVALIIGGFLILAVKLMINRNFFAKV